MKKAANHWRFLSLWIMAMIALLVDVSVHAAMADATLIGKANVVDGDTIEIATIRVRLEGIDAPELRQTCRDELNKKIACGKMATKALVNMIGGKPVTCVLHGLDSFKRQLGECSVDGKSLNARMVREGWALAFVKYSTRFSDIEREAKAGKRGVWQWTFDKPWDWRLGVSEQTARESGRSDGCVIKGNISRKGERIYHMPFHQFYGRTKIDEAKGERWFCTEDEALAAGWRRALR